MPGIIVHTEIARRVAIRLGRTELLNLESSVADFFFQGAVAPDIGVFPGCYTFLSELTHYIHSGALIGKLFAAAESPEQEAFAIGWLSHYFADCLIHPLVNEQAGVIASPENPVARTWEEDPILHLQVELGLDGAMFSVFNMEMINIPAQVLTPSWCRYLADIFTRQYQIAFDPQEILKSHLKAQHYNNLLLKLGIIHRRFHERRIPAPELWGTLLTAYLPARFLQLCLGSRSPYYNVSTVFQPDQQLVSRVSETVNAVVELTVESTGNRGAGLADRNLDTGAPAEAGSYRTLDRCRERLEQLQRGSSERLN